jgi:hypothetical protein
MYRARNYNLLHLTPLNYNFIISSDFLSSRLFNIRLMCVNIMWYKGLSSTPLICSALPGSAKFSGCYRTQHLWFLCTSVCSPHLISTLVLWFSSHNGQHLQSLSVRNCFLRHSHQSRAPLLVHLLSTWYPASAMNCGAINCQTFSWDYPLSTPTRFKWAVTTVLQSVQIHQLLCGRQDVIQETNKLLCKTGWV